MREVSLNDLEIEIIKVIKGWRDGIDVEIDVGEAAALAADIATQVIGHGVGITGAWECHRKLSEGWD